jgi:hypothetical protein
MKKLILLYTCILILFSCNLFNKEKISTLPENWEMIDVFEDEIDEISSGGYYPLFRNEPKPKSDSIPPDEEINDRIVAIAVSDSLVLGKSTARIWVADSKQVLVLDKNETVDKKSYKRTYSNDDFTVDLDMKFNSRIDGLDEEDMIIYSGKMKVCQNGKSKCIEFKVKGGI